MKDKTIGKWIADFGGGCWNFASTVALLLLFDLHPTWKFVWFCVGVGFGLIVLGGVVDATRGVVREWREGRL